MHQHLTDGLGVMNRLGWSAPDAPTLERIFNSKPEIAILAPPLDSVPSPDGNAIYTLVDEIAAKISRPALILSRAVDAGHGVHDGKTREILYYQKSFKPPLLEKIIPGRIRKYLFGMAGLQYFDYAVSAAKLSEMFGIRVLLVQDIPWFCVLSKRVSPRMKVYLHQHNDAPFGMHYANWKKVQSACDGVIYVSHSSKNRITEKHGPHSVPAHVVYNGVNLDRYSLDLGAEPVRRIRERFGLSEETRVLLFVGRIVPGKGPLEAAAAFLKAELENAKFIIAGNLNQVHFGNDDYRGALIALAERSGGRVILAGSISQEDMPALYQVCRVVIIPSIQPEGLPKVMTEAVAMNRPCIVSNRGGMKELLGNGANGWLLGDPTDIDGMSRVIRAAFSEGKIPFCDRSMVDLNRMVRQIEGIVCHG